MATTTSARPTYHIIHGFLGGKLHSRHLRKLLQAHGFTEASDATKADIIITHSGGSYYLLDSMLKPKVIMLAAPALPRKNPKPTYKEANKQIWKTAYQQKYLPKRLLWSLYSLGYAFKQPGRNWRIIRGASNDKLEIPTFDGSTVLFIANQHDPWPRGPQVPKLLKSRPWVFISLPGAHEQLWEHPEQYVEILERYAK